MCGSWQVDGGDTSYIFPISVSMSGQPIRARGWTAHHHTAQTAAADCNVSEQDVDDDDDDDDDDGLWAFLTSATTCIRTRRGRSCWGHRSSTSGHWSRSRKVPWCHCPPSDTWSSPRARFLCCSNSRSPRSCQTRSVPHVDPAGCVKTRSHTAHLPLQHTPTHRCLRVCVCVCVCVTVELLLRLTAPPPTLTYLPPSLSLSLSLSHTHTHTHAHTHLQGKYINTLSVCTVTFICRNQPDRAAPSTSAGTTGAKKYWLLLVVQVQDHFIDYLYCDLTLSGSNVFTLLYKSDQSST